MSFIHGSFSKHFLLNFGFSKDGLNHRARRMQSSLLELLSHSR